MKDTLRKIKRTLSVLSILGWCAVLSTTEGILEGYLLTAIAGLAGNIWCWHRETKIDGKKNVIAGNGVSILLTAAVILANYNLFPFVYDGILGTAKKLCLLAVMLYGGYSVFQGIVLWIYWRVTTAKPQKKGSLKREGLVLLGSWLIIFGVYAFFLYAALYPGFGSSDSASQMRQIFSGVYSNHHPYYHTQMIRFFLSLSQDINTGIGLYNLFSAALLSFSFAYVVYTAYQYTGNRFWSVLILLWYTLIPFHILYSVTMWKDIPFAAAMTIFMTSVFRRQKQIGKYRWGNLVICFVSAVGVCLLRSNGFLAMAASWVVLMLLFRAKDRQLLAAITIALCGCFILKYPVLKAANVVQPDPVESLSIPLQQVSRAITDGVELTQEQRWLLNQVTDVDRIPSEYAMWTSDFEKNLVRERDNQDFFVEHKMEYLKLYLQLGLKYPLSYLNGWIEETKGYWNDGYEYWRWVHPNNDFFLKGKYGITRTVRSQTAVKVITQMVALMDTPVLKPFLCIGLYSWMLLFCMYAAFVRRDRVSWFTAVLPVMVVGTLLVATPVFAEFRYAYGIIASIPMVITACFCPERENP